MFRLPVFLLSFSLDWLYYPGDEYLDQKMIVHCSELVGLYFLELHYCVSFCAINNKNLSFRYLNYYLRETTMQLCVFPGYSDIYGKKQSFDEFCKL